MIAIEPWGAVNTATRETSDADLLRLAASGKQEGITELARRYQKPIHQFLMRFLDSADDAEQATLNVFVRAWESAPRFQHRAKVSTWLFRIAANIARDQYDYRRRRPQTEPFPEGDRFTTGMTANAEEEALGRIERDERAQKLHHALQRLSAEERLILILYYFEERTYEEIQEISGLSYTLLKTRLWRARKRLATLLENELRDEI
jgi:RNA polymerase sigma-70 factor (ECF subfamily)